MQHYSIIFEITALIKTSTGLKSLEKYYCPEFYKGSGILSFDYNGSRIHLNEHDIITVYPRISDGYKEYSIETECTDRYYAYNQARMAAEPIEEYNTYIPTDFEE